MLFSNQVREVSKLEQVISQALAFLKCQRIRSACASTVFLLAISITRF